jgi:hypothetical protein
MAQIAEGLPSKYKTLSSNSSTKKSLRRDPTISLKQVPSSFPSLSLASSHPLHIFSNGFLMKLKKFITFPLNDQNLLNTMRYQSA